MGMGAGAPETELAAREKTQVSRLARSTVQAPGRVERSLERLILLLPGFMGLC